MYLPTNDGLQDVLHAFNELTVNLDGQITVNPLVL